MGSIICAVPRVSKIHEKLLCHLKITATIKYLSGKRFENLKNVNKKVGLFETSGFTLFLDCQPFNTRQAKTEKWVHNNYKCF